MGYAKIIGDLKLLEEDAWRKQNPVDARVFRGLWLELQGVAEDERIKRDQVYASEVKMLTANAQRIRELEGEIASVRAMLNLAHDREAKAMKAADLRHERRRARGLKEKQEGAKK